MDKQAGEKISNAIVGNGTGWYGLRTPKQSDFPRGQSTRPKRAPVHSDSTLLESLSS